MIEPLRGWLSGGEYQNQAAGAKGELGIRHCAVKSALQAIPPSLVARVGNLAFHWRQ